MKFIRSIALRPLLVSLAVPLLSGGAVGLFLALTGRFSAYRELFMPPLNPPAWVFPVVWTVLYTLMGVSAYLVGQSEATQKAREDALWYYLVQLGVNLIWPILFFSLSLRLAAFLWILILIAAVVRMTVGFFFVRRSAALLQIPYLLWCLFAAYLNAGAYLLNG